MQEMQVRSLGQEDPLEEEMATCSSILDWDNPMDRGAWWAIVHGFSESDTSQHSYTYIFSLFIFHPFMPLWAYTRKSVSFYLISFSMGQLLKISRISFSFSLCPSLPCPTPIKYLYVSFTPFLFVCLLVFLWGFLYLCPQVILVCNVLLFCVISLSNFGISWWWPCRMSLRVFFPLQIFGRVSVG